MTCRDVPGQPGHPSSYPEGRTYSPLAKQAVVCPWHRALFRGGCVFCGSRWARFFLLRRAYPCLRRMPVCFLWAVLLPACAACSGQIFRRDRRSAPPISYNAKLLVNEVNGNRNLSFGDEGGQPGNRTFRLCSRCIYQLFPHP